MKRQPDWPVLLLLIAIIFGGLARFMPALVTRFPVNDGGMFHTMARELSANGYALPATTAYNGLDIPYAYPPLGIYLASLLSDLGRIPPLAVFLWLPPFLAALAIPAFYLLARALLADNLRASLAALFFALTPGRYDWHIMGGGVTRAAGMLFLLLAAFCVLRVFSSSPLGEGFRKFCFRGRRDPEVELQDSTLFRSKWKFIFPAILFSSLAVLSHPEVGVQAAGLCAIFWLFHGRTRRGALQAFLVALGVLLLTAPWWGTVIAHHGPAPFLSALQTGGHAAPASLSLPIGLFTSGELIPILLLLRLAGFLYALFTRRWIFIVLVLFPALADPRSAASIAHLSLSMLAALGFLDVLPALLEKARGVEIQPMLAYRPGGIVLLLLAFTLLLECGLNNFRLVNTTLTADEREAMNWARENIPPGRNFLLLTGRPYSMSDPLQEWFPALTAHHSQTTLQGLEWTLGAEFTLRLDALVELQSCPDLACVEDWSARSGLPYDYLWVAGTLAHLEEDIRASAEYQRIYESEAAAIFRRLPLP